MRSPIQTLVVVVGGASCEKAHRIQRDSGQFVTRAPGAVEENATLIALREACLKDTGYVQSTF